MDRRNNRYYTYRVKFTFDPAKDAKNRAKHGVSLALAATTRNGRKIMLNSPEEDVAITAAAQSDPDARPLADAEWEAVKPRLRRAGRPVAARRKVSTTIRFDADVLEALKATGPGWQTRVNDAMREYVATRR